MRAGEENEEIEGERAVEKGALFSPWQGRNRRRPCGTRHADVGCDVARPRVRARMQADTQARQLPDNFWMSRCVTIL
jgi:hypothetical protein